MAALLELYVMITLTVLTYAWSSKAAEECVHGHIVNESQYECHDGPQSVFEYLIYPICTTQFTEQFHQKQPLYISRESLPNYYEIESLPFANAYNAMLDIIDHRSIYDQKHPEIRITTYNANATTQTERYPSVKPFRMDLRQDYKDKLTKAQREQLSNYHKALKHDLNTKFDIGAITQLTLDPDNNDTYTVKFSNTEKHLSSMQALALALSTELGVAVQANLFYVQANSKPTRPHFGPEDVFILQLNGSAHWNVYQHHYRYCIPFGESYPWNVDLSTDSDKLVQQKSLFYCHQNVITNLEADEVYGGYGRFNEEILAQFPANINTTVRAGDLLYFPRGFVHEYDVFGFETPSIHLAVRIYQELQCDFLFTFVRYMFSVEQLSMLWTEMFLVLKKEDKLGLGASAMSVGTDKADIRKAVLREFEYFLQFETFIDDTLRAAMPFGFYHHDIFDDYVYDKIAMPLMEITFADFLVYCSSEKQLNKAGKKDADAVFYRSTEDAQVLIERVVHILNKNKVKKKLAKKVFKHYYNALLEFDGVYLPDDASKDHGKQFKRISYSLRELEKRAVLPKVLKKRKSPS